MLTVLLVSLEKEVNRVFRPICFSMFFSISSTFFAVEVFGDEDERVFSRNVVSGY